MSEIKEGIFAKEQRVSFFSAKVGKALVNDVLTFLFKLYDPYV